MEKKRTKKYLTAAVLLVCLLGVTIYGTLAYFATQERATNVITTGKIDIELVETHNGVAWPDSGIKGVMPGQAVDKVVSVKNLKDTGDAWVRIGVNKSIKMANGNAGDTDLIDIDFNMTDWLDGGDGYYYYKKPLSTEAETEQLFSTVTLAAETGNEYQGCTINIVVTADAVQMKNNKLDADGNVITELTAANFDDIKGWPIAAE